MRPSTLRYVDLAVLLSPAYREDTHTSSNMVYQKSRQKWTQNKSELSNSKNVVNHDR